MKLLPGQNRFWRRLAGLQQLRYQAGPSRLVRGAHAAAAIAVEILVEQEMVAKVRVAPQFVGVPV